MTTPRVILASGSPRRKTLLSLLVDDFDVVVPDVDETFAPGDVALAMEDVADRKAKAVPRGSDDVVIAADTAVLLDGRVLEKSVDREDAREMLWALNGQDHDVVTAVAVHGPHGDARFHVVSKVRVQAPKEIIESYVISEQWQGKAGGYGAQDELLADHVEIEGAWSNVVGLPLHAVHNALLDQSVLCHHPPSEETLRVQNPF